MKINTLFTDPEDINEFAAKEKKMTVTEAAIYLEVSHQKVTRMLKEGMLNSI
jgi:hypothetical protein